LKTDYGIRIKRLRRTIKKSGFDTMMVLVEENRRYLSGFTGEDGSCDESAGALFVSMDNCVLATDSRYELQAQQEAFLFDVYCYREGLPQALPEILSKLKTKTLGFESNRLTVGQYGKMKEQLHAKKIDVDLVETQDVVENLRVIKSKEEIGNIQQALSVAEYAFKAFREVIRPGMTEKEAAWELEKCMHEAGAQRPSFPTIVASGPNSALPHAIPGDRRLRRQEPILFDWGVKLNGYCSDISRTVCLGAADETFQKVFETVLKAQRKAIDAIKPEVSTRHVDAIARNFIENKGFKGKFGHGLGHGAGLAVHEYPRVSPYHEKSLKAGMVFTVEPGIYLPGWGGVRLENMVAVGKEGARVLNVSNPLEFLIEV